MAQHKKGSVVVQTVGRRLRLQWTWAKSRGGDGQRYWLSLGLDDDPVNRAQAELRAKLIEQDLATGQFDQTLLKYQPTTKRRGDYSLLDVYIQFIEFKKRTIRSTSLEKYDALRKHLELFFEDRNAADITSDDCADFRDWLLKKQAPITVNERLGLLSACFDWASGMVSSNPCKPILDAFEVPPAQEPEPFSREEVRRIVEAFRSDSDYAYYGDLVEWLFGVGCRFGEAAALQWRHLNRDCSEVWVGEAIGRDKQRKGTKNLKTRRFELSPRLQQMLLARRPALYQLEDLVFPSRRTGRSIGDQTFSGGGWVTILTKALIPYRKLYNTRHTFVSHALMSGQNPLEVCEITGHDKQTMFDYYARFVGKPKARNLYWD
jgi:integrase